MRRTELAMLFALAASSCRLAAAQAPIDTVERIFGATNVNAVAGHGRLTVGVSRDGDLTVLTWPSPSYSDQLGLITSNGRDARSTSRFGAPEGGGSFLGLVIERAGGAREVTWLRDPATWTASQSYGPDDGANVHTTYESAELGLEVRVVDAVDPSRDILVRAVEVTRDATSPITAAWLLTYANLSPTPPTSRVPELPVVDWALDGRNDYGALFDASSSAVIAFHPDDQRIYRAAGDLVASPRVDFGALGDALRAGTVDDAMASSLVAGLDAAHAGGAYVALSTEPPPDLHQVGYDATPLCSAFNDLLSNARALPMEHPSITLPFDPTIFDALRCDDTAPPIATAEGFVHEAADALEDARDGELSGSSAAAGETNAALRTALVFDASGTARASVLVATGPTARAALDALTVSRADPAAVAQRAEAAAIEWIAGAPLATGPDRVRRVARRSLLNLRVGLVADNGAIVASIARQPPYGLDWPRDGMFFNALLDAVGHTDIAEARAALYASWQRTTDVAPTPIVDLPPPPAPTGRTTTYPAGAWEMNYFPDGMPGGVFRFEIDQVGFAIFLMVAHAGWAPPDRVDEYLRARFASIALAADLLTQWRDAETGLHFPAQEDDNAANTQTLHGAVTTFGALDMASRAARRIGEDARAATWEARASELRDAILTLMYDAEAGRFVSEAATDFNPGSAATGPTAWLVWPMRLLPWDDPRVRAQVIADLDAIEPSVMLATDGGAYVLKNLLSAAIAFGDDPEIGPRVRWMLETLAGHATDTDHFGEVFITIRDGAAPRADQRVSTPHLWEGTLFYLTALALEDPDALLRYDEVLPDSRVGTSGGAAGGACGCSAPGEPQRAPVLAIAILLALGALRRR